jgi:hypothetical protein
VDVVDLLKGPYVKDIEAAAADALQEGRMFALIGFKIVGGHAGFLC